MSHFYCQTPACAGVTVVIPFLRILRVFAVKFLSFFVSSWLFFLSYG